MVQLTVIQNTIYIHEARAISVVGIEAEWMRDDIQIY